MKKFASKLLYRAIGSDWSLRAEQAAAFEITTRLKADRAGRLIVLFALTVLMMWIVPPAVALVWCALILLNIVTEGRYAFHRRLDAPFGGRQLAFLIALRFSSTTYWVIGGLIWMAGDPIQRLLGLALLTGILIHVSHLYNTSRVQTITTGIAAAAGFLVALCMTLFDSEMTLFDKTTTGFGIVAIFGYLINATVQNLKIRERLGILVHETMRLAAEDPLTGLANRRSFVSLVSERTESGDAVTLAFIDLDRFKPLNDQYGHAVGDQVLREIGQRLMWQPDLLAAARLGGDEFAVLFATSSEFEEAAQQMRALHNCLTAPIPSDAGNVSVGASVGWVRADCGYGCVSEVLHSADVAMRRAKTERLGVVEFDPVADSAALVSSAIEIAFRRALAAGNIRAALQPIVSVSTRDIVSMELLARWPDSGFPRDPTPHDFIPIAERLGLLNDMLWSTLYQALPVVARTNWSLAINVSPSQLTSKSFLSKLNAIIAEHGIPTQRIELEITEQVAFRDVAENCAVLDLARALGYRVVLDDFGAGFSSLAMLGHLPLDKIKLDRAFVGELKDHAASQKILQATVSLAQDLGICCSVEGIETAETAAMVASFGCDQMQGYWVGMPELVQPQPVPLELAS